MELQIQELVSSIQKEGIEVAKAEADRIIAEANEKAAAIIAQAKSEAERIEAKSKKEIDLMKDSAKVGAEHAQRDAMLSFKDAVQAKFENLLEADVAKVVQGDTLAALIKAAMADENPADYAAEVAEVTEGLKSELAEQIRSGMEIRISPNVRYGFRLAAKDGSGYFDCSDEELTKMLLPFFPELSF